MPPSARSAAPLVLLAYSVGASFITLAQRYLTFHFDQFTQNFFRFLTGAACLLLLSGLLWPGELRRLLRSREGMAGVGVIAAGGLVAQALVVEGIARTSAVLAGLIALLAVPLAVGIGAAFFPDERYVVRGRGFPLGALLALAGAVGLALTHPAAADGRHTEGVYLLLAATLLGAGLAALSKRMVLSYHPVCVTTLTTSLMCPCFLLGALLWGHPGQIASAPPVTVTILLGSGAWGLLIGGALYYFCLQKYGMVLTTFTNLAIPVFTGLFGYLIFREALTLPEIASAAVLLGGCYLVVSARKSSATSAPAP